VREPGNGRSEVDRFLRIILRVLGPLALQVSELPDHTQLGVVLQSAMEASSS
jgi:hypothetical protein